MKLRHAILSAASLLVAPGAAFACQAPALPEPSTLSILGIGAVAGIVVWRITRKK